MLFRSLAVQADGSVVNTVAGVEGAPEGLAATGGAEGNDSFGTVQESFHQEHGLQCGYCTPGMMLSAADLLEENPDPDREEVREALEGNLCRCTGYQNIVNAVQNAAEQMGTTGGDAAADDVAAADGGRELDLTADYPTDDGGDSE